MLECAIKKTEEILGCTPWFLPQGKDFTMCDPWSQKNFSSLMTKYEQNCTSCLPNCETTKLEVLTTEAEIG